MRPVQSTVLTCFAGAAFLLAAAMGNLAQAVTKLHDPAVNHTTVVNGVTNGHGVNRGPGVVQIAAAKDERLELYVAYPAPSSPFPILRVIAGNGSVYFADLRVCAGPNCAVYACVLVPVTGWVTVHADPVGATEQRLEFGYRRSYDRCEFDDAPH